jgi:8-oxo-dGTP pyrophosphatase MutT (NUDIX family)
MEGKEHFGVKGNENREYGMRCGMQDAGFGSVHGSFDNNQTSNGSKVNVITTKQFPNFTPEMKQTILRHIEERFSGKMLPGREANLEMAPLSRRKAFPIREDYFEASVMLLLYPGKSDLCFPLIIRTNNYPNDKHSGQIALPGGRREPADLSHWHCALREAEEELGIEHNGIRKIGALTPNYIPVSNYQVYPFVGFLNEQPVFNRQVSEVAGILEIDLKDLLDPANKKTGEIILASGIRLDDIPFFDLAGQKVWGATAMMLNEFVRLIQN